MKHSQIYETNDLQMLSKKNITRFCILYFMKTKIFPLALMEGKILFDRFFCGQKNWNDSRTTVLEIEKIVAPKKNSTFADDFFCSDFERLNF